MVQKNLFNSPVVISGQKIKNRKYNAEYLAYGFVESKDDSSLPLCLICLKVFTNSMMKPAKMKMHLKAVHPNKVNSSAEYFESLKRTRLENKNMGDYSKCHAKNLALASKISNEISYVIGNIGYPHLSGETLIKPILWVLLKYKTADETTTPIIPLSNNTISRNIDRVGEFLEKNLIEKIKGKKNSIQLDESILINEKNMLLMFVRYFDPDHGFVEEMLFYYFLNENCTGQSIFHLTKKFFDDNGLKLTDIVSCATDGAPSMVGKHKGFVAFLKTEVENLISIHCVIHKQHLVSKNLSENLSNSFSVAIKIINKIKNSKKNNKIFALLCQNLNDEYDKLVYYTEVRWLSRGQALNRLMILKESIAVFLNENNEGELLKEFQNSYKDLVFLSDIFEKYNVVYLLHELFLIKNL